jgi:hypothetical protein
MTEQKERMFITIDTPIKDTTAKGKIRNVFDKTYESNLYDPENINEDGIPLLYNKIYNDYKNLTDVKQLITLSFDQAITSASVCGKNEQYIQLTTEKGKGKYVSDMKILYIDSMPDLRCPDSTTILSFANGVVSNMLCIDNITYTKHKMAIDPKQIIYLKVISYQS